MRRNKAFSHLKFMLINRQQSFKMENYSKQLTVEFNRATRTIHFMTFLLIAVKK